MGGHDYILPRVRISHFKSTCVNRCLFGKICLLVILHLILCFMYFISIVNKAQLLHYWYLINTIIIIIRCYVLVEVIIKIFYFIPSYS